MSEVQTCSRRGAGLCAACRQGAAGACARLPGDGCQSQPPRGVQRHVARWTCFALPSICRPHAPFRARPCCFQRSTCRLPCRAELMAADGVEKTLRIVITRHALHSPLQLHVCAFALHGMFLFLLLCRAVQHSCSSGCALPTCITSACRHLQSAGPHYIRPLPPLLPTPVPVPLPPCSKLVKQRNFLEALEERLEPPLKQVRGGQGAPCGGPSLGARTRCLPTCEGVVRPDQQRPGCCRSTIAALRPP